MLDDLYYIQIENYTLINFLAADKGDLTQWLEYFTDGLKYWLQSAISRDENSLSQISVPMRLTARERQVLNKFLSTGVFYKSL